MVAELAAALFAMAIAAMTRVLSGSMTCGATFTSGLVMTGEPACPGRRARSSSAGTGMVATPTVAILVAWLIVFLSVFLDVRFFRLVGVGSMGPLAVTMSTVPTRKSDGFPGAATLGNLDDRRFIGGFRLRAARLLGPQLADANERRADSQGQIEPSHLVLLSKDRASSLAR
jgi:hypothetical protein